MPTRKRKKNTRMRGSMTHGWGAKKKHRGSGHRGGRGMAGTGKRADTKKPSIWTDKYYFGKYGFVRPRGKKVKGVDISYLEEKYLKLKEKGIIKEEGGYSIVSLENIGFQKLLSAGNPSRKYRVTAEQAVKKAIEKIMEKGGEVIVPEVKHPKAKEAGKREIKEADKGEEKIYSK